MGSPKKSMYFKRLFNEPEIWVGLFLATVGLVTHCGIYGIIGGAFIGFALAAAQDI